MNLTKCSGIFTCLIVITLSTHGQTIGNTTEPNNSTSFETQTYFGFRTGYSNYHMTGSEADFRTTPYRVQFSDGSVDFQDKNKPIQWFTVGAIYRQKIYKRLAFQLEINYLREGGSFEAPPFGGYTLDRTNFVIDNLHIPILLNLQAFAIGPLTMHLEGGIAANIVVNGVELDRPNLHPSNIFNNPSVIPASVCGAEIAWRHQKSHYLLNFRYTNDLTDFYQREYIGTHYNLKSKGFSVSTGVLFGQ
ncbi:outer membrane beta-barrel protein [Hymenobacter sp. BT507]|uniref:Outer membrane beta-barrel protein n=1 Tax=Hymenobacter citatus TaxID=2763506 RepID=A0ABR7MJK6_9BACT|nr:outer membrane beta-barrel protein [Hymenobacter citatus]MBC6611267.1 outer membrane beta-barrel protein [Hymenobacter citatus]